MPPFGGLARPERAKNLIQKDFKIFISHVGTQFCEKKGEELPQLCVCKHGCRSKLPSTHGNTHTTMATPLPFSVEIAVCSRCEQINLDNKNRDFWPFKATKMGS